MRNVVDASWWMFNHLAPPLPPKEELSRSPQNGSNARARPNTPENAPRLLQEWALEDPSPRARQLFGLPPTGIGARHRRAALDLAAFVDQLLRLEKWMMGASYTLQKTHMNPG